jgi:hypothetical protein
LIDSTKTIFEINAKKTLFFIFIFIIFLLEGLSFLILETRSPDRDYYEDKKVYQRVDMHTFYNYKPNTKTSFNWGKKENSYIDWEFDSNGLVKTPTTNIYNTNTVKTIVIFGGSTIFGVGSSSQSTTIAANIQELLNQENGTKYRVLNAGVRGYNSYQEYIRYLNDIRQLNPDIIIDINGYNDVFNSINGQQQENFDSEYSLDLEKKINAPDNNFENFNKIFNNSYSYRLLNKVVNRLVKNIPTKSEEVIDFSITEESIEKALDNYLFIMDNFKFAVESEGKEFYWILQPTPSYKKILSLEEKLNLDHAYSKYLVSDFREKLVFSYNYILDNNKNIIDLSGIFEDNSNTLYIDTCHYNDQANKIIASNVVEIILKRN